DQTEKNPMDTFHSSSVSRDKCDGFNNLAREVEERNREIREDTENQREPRRCAKRHNHPRGSLAFWQVPVNVTVRRSGTEKSAHDDRKKVRGVEQTAEQKNGQ